MWPVRFANAIAAGLSDEEWDHDFDEDEDLDEDELGIRSVGWSDGMEIEVSQSALPWLAIHVSTAGPQHC